MYLKNEAFESFLLVYNEKVERFNVPGEYVIYRADGAVVFDNFGRTDKLYVEQRPKAS